MKLPNNNDRFLPNRSVVKAAAMAPINAPTSYKAVMVDTMIVAGLPISSSQYDEMTPPDMTPLS
jgi:hypothetical protein